MRAGGLACTLLILAFGASNALPQYSNPGNQDQHQGQEQLPPGIIGGVPHSAGVDVGVEQTSDILGGSCPIGTKCVTQYECINGSLNTGGIGLIDVRVKPTGVVDVPIACVNPEHPEVKAECCKIPGFPEPQVSSCEAHQDCVPRNLCNADGSINTDGSFNIDVRINTPCYSETNERGVCCDRPKPAPIESCPSTSQCRAAEHCTTPGPLNAIGLYTECYLSDGSTGICCQPPEPVDLCPADFQCRDQGHCGPSTHLDLYGFPTECYGNGGFTGVCCVPPAPIETCLDGFQCRKEGHCAPDFPLDPYGSPTACLVFGEVGVCCQPPPPVHICPVGECRLEGHCHPDIPLDPYGLPTSCHTAGGEIGVCCEPPAPIATCDLGLQCRSAEHCGNNVPLDPYGSATSCYFGGGDIGVCCEPPAPINSCSAGLDCRDSANCGVSTPLDLYGSPTSCYYGFGSVGVCCESPAPITTCPANSVCRAAANCGARGLLDNYGSPTPCYVAGSDAVGICCSPVDTCDTDLVCTDQCNTPSLGYTDGTYTACYKNDGSGTGVCCEPPARVVDVCPADSVCLPEILCTGDLLNEDNAFVPYSNGVKYSTCPLSGNLAASGVCCKNKPPPQFPVANTCGVRNYPLDLRVTNNEVAINEANFGEFPWMAIIFFTNYTYKCGASLISDRHLITGAHCVHNLLPGDIQIRLGEWQVNSYHEPLKYADYAVAAIDSHPGFNPANLHNDISVLTLATPVVFDYHINTVCLPDATQDFTGTYCYATGWGKDSFEGSYQVIMKQVDLPLVDNVACQEKLRKTRLGKHFILDPSFTCAGGVEGKDACTGDGGGPLVCQATKGGPYILKGITAWGIGCGVKDVPGVYADVQSPQLASWLQGVLNPVQQQQGLVGAGYGK